jgi:hypothetical protein
MSIARHPLPEELPEVLELSRKLVTWYLANPGTEHAFVVCRTPEITGKTNAERRADCKTLDVLERLRELIGRDESIVQARIEEHRKRTRGPAARLERWSERHRQGGYFRAGLLAGIAFSSIMLAFATGSALPKDQRFEAHSAACTALDGSRVWVLRRSARRYEVRFASGYTSWVAGAELRSCDHE